MRNFLVFIGICLLLAVTMMIGAVKRKLPENKAETLHTETNLDIPYIGRIQVLNGCGIEGAANAVADYLRSNNFDVKNIGNADTWNYPFTMVISRTKEMTIADQIADVLHTNKVVMIQNEENLYDVTVVIGPDYGERIQ